MAVSGTGDTESVGALSDTEFESDWRRDVMANDPPRPGVDCFDSAARRVPEYRTQLRERIKE